MDYTEVTFLCLNVFALLQRMLFKSTFSFLDHVCRDVSIVKYQASSMSKKTVTKYIHGSNSARDEGTCCEDAGEN